VKFSLGNSIIFLGDIEETKEVFLMKHLHIQWFMKNPWGQLYGPGHQLNPCKGRKTG